MLTPKQNLDEVIRGGNPDRFVNQYEAIYLMFHPYIAHSNALLSPGDENVVNAWGVTNSFPAHTPGAFPVHTPDKIVIKDIENWRDYVHAPGLEFSQDEWDAFKAQYDEVDGNMAYKATFVAPGIFEQTHHLSEITNALVYYMLNPKEMHELIKYITEWELKLAEGICANLKPDAILHHDDWGSNASTFMAPEMMEEFFHDPYKEIYKYYHDHGVKLIIHHADSYAATLVPMMIDVGVDIWQGCMESNDVPALVEKYGGKITFMGNIDNKSMDFPGWTREDCRRATLNACEKMEPKFYIPCITQGGPGSTCKGAYEVLTEEIDKYNEERFGIKAADVERLPLQLIF